MKFIYSGVSSQNKRPTNQDSLYIEARDANGCTVLLAVVCDGVGSLKNGEIAGIYAVEMLKSWFSSVLYMMINDDLTMPNPLKLLSNELHEINRKIYTYCREENIQTGSTISVLLLVGERYFIAHLGDSRIYYYNQKTYCLVTKDHIAAVKSSGKAKMGLTQCLGTFESVEPFFQEGTLTGKDIFMMCSDGFYRQYPMESLPEKFRRANSPRALSEAISQQIAVVESLGEIDNISLAVIKSYK